MTNSERTALSPPDFCLDHCCLFSFGLLVVVWRPRVGCLATHPLPPQPGRARERCRGWMSGRLLYPRLSGIFGEITYAIASSFLDTSLKLSAPGDGGNSRRRLHHRPTVSLGVTYAVADTYGCDSGRIVLTRCAIIDARLDGRCRLRRGLGHITVDT